MFAQSPGLKIVVPATPYDAKGLMKAAIRDDNPVLFFEDGTLLGRMEELPEDDYVVPIGVADIKRKGDDVTVVAIGGAVAHALRAADQLAQRGISVEVVDLRTIVPLDEATIVQSVAKTGRLVIADPGPRMCGVAAEIAARVAENAFGHLGAPIVRVAAIDVPVPFSPAIERLIYPDLAKITSAVETLFDNAKVRAIQPAEGE